METPCVHYEDVADVNYRGQNFRLGTCRKCGQVKWYDTENTMAPPVIIRPGMTEIEREKETVAMAKLKAKEKKELFRLGVDKYMEVHNCNPRAKSALSQSYNKLLAKQMKKKGLIASQSLPPLMADAIAILPNPPRELDEESRKQLKELFGNIIDILYGKQVFACRGQRSAPGG